MSKNIIFCFSGTGNSLHVAKKLSVHQEDCSIIGMTGSAYDFEKTVESVGFIYPTYFGGLPLQVEKFVSGLKITKQMYTYGIATYGGMVGNGVNDLNTLMKRIHGRGLDYGKVLLMLENYIGWYDIRKYIDQEEKITRASDEKINTIITELKDTPASQNFRTSQVIRLFHKIMAKRIPTEDQYFSISGDCISCDRCKKICPVGNISMKDGKPSFHGKCEQCLACIHTCPKAAINYKNKTQTRGRYFHPNVKVDELINLN